MIEKCKYYNDCQTAFSLMVDDLVPAMVSYDSTLKPWNDWGYGRNTESSLYHYVKTNLLQKYPEVRGTIFIPIDSHNYLCCDSGMHIKRNDYSQNDLSFFEDVKTVFDFGFHGVKHTYNDKNSVNSPITYEFSELGVNDVDFLKGKIRSFEEILGVSFTGGKFPGYYRMNNQSYLILEKLGFKWWALSLADNKKGTHNELLYLENDKSNIVNVPSNLNGNVFNRKLYKSSKLKNWGYRFRDIKRTVYNENYIDYLYSNQLPITVQEHFQNQSFNGKRQQPNVFDDILSLERIFSYMRGADIWHVNCSELAHYFDSYVNTNIDIQQNIVRISYQGHWDKMKLSFKSKCPSLENKETGKVYTGIRKGGKWIYNDLMQGEYILKDGV